MGNKSVKTNSTTQILIKSSNNTLNQTKKERSKLRRNTEPNIPLPIPNISIPRVPSHRDSVPSSPKDRSEGRITQWKNNKALAKNFSKYEETCEGDEKSMWINLESLINDIKLFHEKTDEEKLFFQLILLWQIAGGGDQAHQQLQQVRQNISTNFFFDALRSMSCHTLEQLENYVLLICKYLKGDDSTYKFNDFYKFCFYYGRIENSKVLERDVAILLWKSLLKDKFPLLFMWCNFLEKKETKGINLDTWGCFLDFVSIIHSDMSNFDPEGAWPSLIDEFVQYTMMSESTLQNICIKKVASFIRDGKISKKNLELLPPHFKLAIQQYSKIMTWNI